MTTEQTMSAEEKESHSTALVKDIESIVTDTTQLLKEVADSSAEEFIAMRAQVETKLDKAKSRLVNARNTAMVKVKSTADAGCRYAYDNPWKVFWMTAAVGVVIGAFMYRRCR
ncbi:MAG: DUF883 family protein [Azovibrio sp.]